MALHPLAGQAPTSAMLVDVAKLLTQYYTLKPDAAVAAQRVSFGTSGHRGSSALASFNEDHILAITQAICEYRGADAHRWPAIPGQGHARALGAGLRHGARSACGQRRRDDGGSGPGIYAHAGALARHSQLQPRTAGGAGRRDCDHALAQSTGRWRLQVQPSRRRAGRHHGDEVDREPRQRTARSGLERSAARRLRAGAGRLRIGTITSRLM